MQISLSHTHSPKQDMYITNGDGPAAFSEFGSWDLATNDGSVSVTLLNPGLEQDDVRVFSFKVNNPTKTCGGTPALSVALSEAEACSTGHVVTGNVAFLQPSIAQSSGTPCADNVITVKFRVSHPLVPDCAPAITLSGLTNTQTEAAKASLTASTATIFPMDLISVPSEISRSALWNRVQANNPALKISLNRLIRETINNRTAGTAEQRVSIEQRRVYPTTGLSGRSFRT